MEILARINWVDILVLIIIIRTSYVALQDGLSHEILPFFGSVCMLVFSLHYYTRIASFFYNNGLALPIELLNLFGFILSAVCIGILFRFIRALIDRIIKVSWHPVLEKFGGLLAGLARGVVLASAVLVMLVLIPLPYLRWSVVNRSMTGVYFLRVGPAIYEKASGLLPVVPVKADELMKNLVPDKTVAADQNQKKKPAVKR